MNRIELLRNIRIEISRLHNEERKLVTPIEMNIAMVRNLYDVFQLSLKRQDITANPLDTNNRKKFLYSMLYIFSPVTLAGGAMRHRFRECISTVIGCTPPGVSRDYKTAMFFYATYKNFRDSVDKIIVDILSVLGRVDEIREIV